MVKFTFRKGTVPKIFRQRIRKADPLCRSFPQNIAYIIKLLQFADLRQPRLHHTVLFHPRTVMPNSSGKNTGQVLSFVAMTDDARRVPITAASRMDFP